VLAGDWLVRIDTGAILHLLFRQRHIQSGGLPVQADDRNWRDQHSPATQPAEFYGEVPDGPSLIVEIKLIYSAKLAVRSSHHETVPLLRIPQHVFLPSWAMAGLHLGDQPSVRFGHNLTAALR
jgi:hypothetical protein